MVPEGTSTSNHLYIYIYIIISEYIYIYIYIVMKQHFIVKKRTSNSYPFWKKWYGIKNPECLNFFLICILSDRETSNVYGNTKHLKHILHILFLFSYDMTNISQWFRSLENKLFWIWRNRESVHYSSQVCKIKWWVSH